MAQVEIGSDFAGYRIEGVAGEGGMGRVYRATQLGLKRQVALKLIVPALADDPGFRVRFERESELMAAIEHPNVIPVYEAGEAEGRLFIAMRWVEGTDLRSVIVEEGRLEPGRVVAIAGQIAAALDAAHRGGLVHRDVKPANVMLTTAHGQEQVYLTDFGLTKRAESASGVTKTGQFVGTPDYMSPEQIKGEPADARADVYALGCVLFHALTGRVPYERDSEVAKMYAHVNDPPPSVVETVPGTPVEIDDVITRALAKDPDERYPSAGDLNRATRAALRGDDPSQPERSLATGLAAPHPAGVDPTQLSPGGVPTAPGAMPTAPGAMPTAPGGMPTAPGGMPTAPGGAPAAPGGMPTAPGSAPTAPGAAPAEPARSAGAAEAPPRAPAPPAPPPGPPTGPTSALPPERARRRGMTIGLAALLGLGVVVGLLAATGVLSGGGEDESAPASKAAAKSSTPRVVATIRAGNGPDGIAVDGNDVWVSNADGDALRLVDAKSNKAAGEPVPVGDNPDEVAAEDGVVWVANTDDGSVTRLDLTSSSGTSSTIPVGSGPEGLSLGKQLVWVANGGDDSVSRIDRASATRVGSPIPVGDNPIGIFVGKDTVWVTNSFSQTVTRIDPSSAEVIGRPVRVGKNIRNVTEGLGSVWVSSVDEDTVTRLNPKTGAVVGDPIPVGDRPKGMAVLDGLLWVVNEGGNSVTRLDSKGKEVGSPIRVGRKPVDIAAGAGSLWVTNNGSDTVTRIDP